MSHEPATPVCPGCQQRESRILEPERQLAAQQRDLHGHVLRRCQDLLEQDPLANDARLWRRLMDTLRAGLKLGLRFWQQPIQQPLDWSGQPAPEAEPEDPAEPDLRRWCDPVPGIASG
jgi:hypothetical protein